MGLREMRICKGLTQNQVALEFVVSQVTISQWETGDSYPHPSKIPKLAGIYGKTEKEIIMACDAARTKRQSIT